MNLGIILIIFPLDRPIYLEVILYYHTSKFIFKTNLERRFFNHSYFQITFLQQKSFKNRLLKPIN